MRRTPRSYARRSGATFSGAISQASWDRHRYAAHSGGVHWVPLRSLCFRTSFSSTTFCNFRRGPVMTILHRTRGGRRRRALFSGQRRSADLHDDAPAGIPHHYTITRDRFHCPFGATIRRLVLWRTGTTIKIHAYQNKNKTYFQSNCMIFSSIPIVCYRTVH